MPHKLQQGSGTKTDRGPLHAPNPSITPRGVREGAVTGLLVLLRHGQSQSNLEERFTGWQDVGLTTEGREGARRAARALSDAGLAFDAAFSSCLTRAVSTLRIVLDEMDRGREVPVRSSWRLNERHYGALQGLEKAEAEARYGEERVSAWRRGYRSCPPAAEPPGSDGPRWPSPLTESLEDVSKRVLPYWFDTIAPSLEGEGRTLVVAHGNSLRALVKHLEGLSEEEVEVLEIPPARPLVYGLLAGQSPRVTAVFGENGPSGEDGS